jgi:GNAT superfamily N-acetyltransferase
MIENYSIKRENFPRLYAEFLPLWQDEGREVRFRPMKLNVNRYREIERENRLIWIVARNRDSVPIGYCCEYWFVDLHFCDKIGCGDIWYVVPAWRKCGIGKQLKLEAHRHLKDAGIVETYETIRHAFAPEIMRNLGYESCRTQWTKTL